MSSCYCGSQVTTWVLWLLCGRLFLILVFGQWDSGVHRKPTGVIQASTRAWKAVFDRLQISSMTDILVEPWDPPQMRTAHYWTDGSVVLARDFWKTRASYAVIDECGHVVASGKVYHWCLSSYTAELYAIIVAFAASEGPCIIHTDYLTVVQHFHRLSQCDELPFSLQLRAWWVFLFDLIASRQFNGEPVLQLFWCPAHSWDHLPLECVTDEMLATKSLSREDLCFNRKADLVAKEHLDAYNASAQQTFQLERCSIQRQHLWLADLHRYLSEDLSNRIPASWWPKCTWCEGVIPQMGLGCGQGAYQQRELEEGYQLDG